MSLLRRRPRLCLLAAGALLLSGATIGEESATPSRPEAQGWPARSDALSILTFNVKGLPWPVAVNRQETLFRIGERLASMRRLDRQPRVVVLQEAFSEDALRIAELSGYRTVVYGPDLHEKAGVAVSGATKDEAGWHPGPAAGAVLGSGLILLSDYPVTKIARARFPDGACAGFDCMAAKGVLLVRLSIPGSGEVSVATTHFNSRGASRAPLADTARAYAAQARFLDDFLGREWAGETPLVVAGDFNRGERPFRKRVLARALRRLDGGRMPVEALELGVARRLVADGRVSDAEWIRHRGRDLQFVLASAERRVIPVAVAIPFGIEADGTTMSDHLGYTVYYKFGPAAERTKGRASPT